MTEGSIDKTVANAIYEIGKMDMALAESVIRNGYFVSYIEIEGCPNEKYVLIDFTRTDKPVMWDDYCAYSLSLFARLTDRHLRWFEC
jgi:hypothetical protein